MSSDLCVFTSGDNLDLLKESCESVTVTLHTFESRWTDYVDIKLRKAIQFLTTRPETYMMWVDGNDSLILRPEHEIMSRLHSLGDPVLISGEANCWPDADLAPFYLKKQDWPSMPASSPRYINAGGWIGHKEQLLTTLHTVLGCAKDGDDQRAWTSAYLADLLPYVQIDHGRMLFASMGDGESSYAAKSCVKHWNGKVPGRQEYWAQHVAGMEKRG